MKKILLSVAAIMALGTLEAQEINFGAKAGLNLTTLTGDGMEDATAKAGFHAGLVAEFKLMDNLAIQPELLYSAQGSKQEYSEDGDSFEIVQKLNYLTLPIMAKYYVFEGFSLEAGPQISYLLSADEEYEEKVDGDSYSESADIKDELKPIDFGINGGVGYELPMGLFAQARYTVGLTNIIDGESDDFDWKNAGFQLSVGYKF